MKRLRISPYALIFLGGAAYIVHSLGGELLEQFKYDDLKNQFVHEQTIDDNVIDYSNSFGVETESITVEDGISYVETDPITINEEEIVAEEVEYVPVEEINSDLLSSGYEFCEVDFEALKNTNPEACAWIVIDGTNINYPIMYREGDNNYYLHHNIEGQETQSGSIFLDGRAESFDEPMYNLNDVSVLYGHHMRAQKMFGTICNYKTQDYYEQHPYAVIYTADGYAYQAEIFGGILVPGDETGDAQIYHNDFATEEEFNAFIQNIYDNTYFQSDVEVEYGDKILAMVTCSYENGLDGNLRYVVFAKLSKQYTNELQVVDDVNASRGR